jgi:GDP-L-fucose synthase
MKSRIWIPGAAGMLGRSIINLIDKKRYKVFKTTKKELNLFDQKKIEFFIKKNKIKEIILCASKVGGIYANNKFPADFLLENLKLQNNIFETIIKYKIKKFTFIGSSCIYPKKNKLPIKEESLLTGSLEQTNYAYAIAKIAGVKAVQSINQQYKTRYKSVMLTNMYGPNDNFNLKTSHVVPALLRKFYEAKLHNSKTVEIWGTGKPKRDVLYVNDAAKAVLLYHRKKSKYSIVNVGSGKEISIKQMALVIAKIVGFKGSIVFNKKYPDGTYRKILDLSKIKKLGWSSSVDFQTGIKLTLEWLKKNYKRNNKNKIYD